VRAFYEITPLAGLQAIGGKTIQLNYAQGYEIVRGGVSKQALIDEAVTAAKKSDVAIIVGGWTHGYNYSIWKDNAYDAEDYDKPDMNMPFGQDELISAVLKANPKTIVVLFGGGAIDMSRWLNNTPAVIQAWYPGMEGGKALARIIFGTVNPSGKLPMTFPKKLEDHPSHKLGEYPGNDQLIENYLDDIYVGYRYFDTYKVDPQFAFGHGLSYTNFEYSGLKAVTNGKGATITLTVKNTGKTAGMETVQVYVKQEHSSLPRPEKELKGFDKIFLQPGESGNITIQLNENAFQYYNDLSSRWVMEKGTYQILVGSSSRDIRLSQKIVF
jgi:beta-glucosidase